MAHHPRDGALVCVWRNDPSLARTIAGAFGHAALKLVGPSFEAGGHDGVYVSWWPTDTVLRSKGWREFGWKETPGEASSSYKMDEVEELGRPARRRLTGATPDGTRSLPRPNQRVVNPGDPVDRWQWIRTPDAKVFIPGVAVDAPFGLNLGMIEAWWRVFSGSKKAVWSTLDRNCSVIVGKALRAGGAHALVSKPMHVIARPVVVEQWARRLAARCAKKNAAVLAAVAGVADSRMAPHRTKAIWTSAEWHARTDHTVDAHRGSFAYVGALLVQYASIVFTDATAGKLHIGILQKILDTLNEDVYHAGALGHARLAAPLELGVQCLGAIEYWNGVAARRPPSRAMDKLRQASARAAAAQTRTA